MNSSNRRLAKNTLLLYFRMILTMGVSFYTVRVVLDTLGEVDYGLFNVVGGLVAMLAFMSGTMASASQRYFAFELGRKDYKQLKKTFSMTLTIYVIIGLIILLLAETVGLWFLNTQMNIPSERMSAANWVYQFSIFSFMMTMFTVPYNATIIAHERMNIYAYVSIIEVILKLAVVYLLVVFSYDKLKLYAVLMFAVTTLVTFIYRTYCIRKFDECRFSFYWDRKLFGDILSYSGWNLFGVLAGVFNNNGINVILNIFFGPIVNTSRGIAYQVNTAINQFAQNFMTAVKPQIIKHYARGEKEQLMTLLFQSSKFSYFLLFILTMPILLETDFVLNLWLRHMPDHVVLFTRLIIVAALIDSLSYPLQTAAQATGKVKKYQIFVGGVMLLHFPISLLFLKMGYSAQTVFYLSIINSLFCLFSRLIMLQNMIELSIKDFFILVVSPVILVSAVAYIIPLFLLSEMNEGLVRFFAVIFICLLTSTVSIYALALSRNEREYISKVLSGIVRR